MRLGLACQYSDLHCPFYRSSLTDYFSRGLLFLSAFLPVDFAFSCCAGCIQLPWGVGLGSVLHPFLFGGSSWYGVVALELTLSFGYRSSFSILKALDMKVYVCGLL